MIAFMGYSINEKQVLSIGKVKRISTGSMACSWDFGFDIYLNGNTITILCPVKIDGCYDNLLSQGERKCYAEQMKSDLLILLQDKLH